VECESREITYEPLDMIGKDDPVTCAEFAHWMNLLSTPGWKRFRHIYKNPKQVELMVNQAKLRSYRREPFWKFGVTVPRTHNQAAEIVQSSGKCLWQESEATEMTEYKTFIDNGKGGIPPDGYKKIRCHMVLHDGRNKCRPVAGGHLTEPNTESVYFSVVSL
jgi:hypothetical protein